LGQLAVLVLVGDELVGEDLEYVADPERAIGAINLGDQLYGVARDAVQLRFEQGAHPRVAMQLQGIRAVRWSSGSQVAID
jgi:hypothetical protein